MSLAQCFMDVLWGFACIIASLMTVILPCGVVFFGGYLALGMSKRYQAFLLLIGTVTLFIVASASVLWFWRNCSDEPCVVKRVYFVIQPEK